MHFCGEDRSRLVNLQEGFSAKQPAASEQYARLPAPLMGRGLSRGTRESDRNRGSEGKGRKTGGLLSGVTEDQEDFSVNFTHDGAAAATHRDSR